jgi:hypothetical protein
MAPAVADNATIAQASDSAFLYNPFHPPASNDDDDTNYPYAQFKVSQRAKIQYILIVCYLAVLP